MKKYNPCLGICNTRSEADAIVKRLGEGHPVKSGAFWRVFKYPPGKAPALHEAIRKTKAAPTSNTEGQ